MGQEKLVTLAERCVKTCCKTGLSKKLPYVPPEMNLFSITGSEFRLLSSDGENLSSLFYLKSDNCIDILDISSSKKGLGYGTKLLQMFNNLFNDKKINLAACWERGVSPTPPHKFYIQNGFVPVDKKADEALKIWIERGGKSKDFPMEYELCEMTRLPNS